MNVKKIILMLITAFSTLSASSQIDSEIVGTWEVDSVGENKEYKLNYDEQKEFKKLKKAEITFTADHHAKFKLFFTGFNIGDGYWYYNAEKDVIVITKWNDRKVDRMRLWYDLLPDGRIRFYIDETDFVLVVKRKTE